ncbi:MAG: 16S rRNA (guanine(527)-N(7))-methyltransferase RsmG [Nitrospirae bacterium]|nr:16S rRNA (guanine(527)-N(7))-methyltransferase RsmG [Nitrospirota bacterium]
MNSEELLIKGLEELRLTHSKKEIDVFLTFLSELKKWRRAYNLTALKTDEDIIVKHFLDSLLYLKALPAGKLHIADIGSGAGFPGVPIKIMRPEIKMTLVESSRKKSAFLRHIIRELGLSEIEVLQKRAEEIGGDFHKYFDVIASRATFDIAEFIKAACPYLKNDGLLVISKGPRFSKEEITGGAGNAVFKEVIRTGLKHEGIVRNLVVLKCR